MYVSKKLLNPTSSKRRFDSYPMPGSRFRARHLFVFCLVTCCVRRAGVACEGSRERNPPRRPLRQSKAKHNRAGDKKKKEKSGGEKIFDKFYENAAAVLIRIARNHTH